MSGNSLSAVWHRAKNLKLDKEPAIRDAYLDGDEKRLLAALIRAVELEPDKPTGTGIGASRGAVADLDSISTEDFGRALAGLTDDSGLRPMPSTDQFTHGMAPPSN